ncbi:MAG: hypothetical protein U9Q04_05650 [Campylobacterota bacterium]|nr:hypothetical protein [Campylobacterota bacterium]
MSDEFSQLDELIESEVLEALGEEPSAPNINDIIEIPPELLEDDTNKEETEDIELPDDILEESETIDEQDIESIEQITEDEEISDESANTTMSVSKENAGDLLSVLSQLLNNKTIEITIKIKD